MSILDAIKRVIELQELTLYVLAGIAVMFFVYAVIDLARRR